VLPVPGLSVLTSAEDLGVNMIRPVNDGISVMLCCLLVTTPDT
jgi:hypothetical protein